MRTGSPGDATGAERWTSGSERKLNEATQEQKLGVVSFNGTTFYIKPKVTLIGRPFAEFENIRAAVGELSKYWEVRPVPGGMVREIGITPESNVVPTDGEAIIEFGGRACYQSFGKGRPSNEFFENILDSGHGCYDAETQVLTASGWMYWPDYVEAWESGRKLAVATRSSSGKTEYQIPTAVAHADYSGRMYRVDSQGVDLLVTPNHRMFVCKTTTKAGRKKETYSLIEAQDLGHVSHAYVKSGEFEDATTEDACSPSVSRLIGFAIGDGYLRSKGVVDFHLRRERKIIWLKRAAKSAKFLLEEFPERDLYRLHIPDENSQNLFGQIYSENKEKQIPDGLLFSSVAVQESLYEGLMESDGHHGRTGDSFDTTSDRLAGQFQQLCLHIGLAANVCYRYENRLDSFGDKPLTRLSIIRRALKPEVNKWTGCDGKTSWVENWVGEIFCAQVPNGVLYVQRSGRPVWCGNSVLEHANWSLYIEGVSRSFTHELVRHRAGFAFSQLSQRYVDESDTAFVVPPDYTDVAGTSDPLWLKWAGMCMEQRDLYVWLVEQRLAKAKAKFPNSPTDARKWARQAARSVLGNATETKILVTANGRAWRHFLNMRGSLHADPEIRAVAVAIADILKEEAPLLFGDVVKSEDVASGETCLTLAHPKV